MSVYYLIVQVSRFLGLSFHFVKLSLIFLRLSLRFSGLSCFLELSFRFSELNIHSFKDSAFVCLNWATFPWIQPSFVWIEPTFPWIQPSFVWIEPTFPWIQPSFVWIEPTFPWIGTRSLDWAWMRADTRLVIRRFLLRFSHVVEIHYSETSLQRTAGLHQKMYVITECT